jgi:hypothetical protein
LLAARTSKPFGGGGKIRTFVFAAFVLEAVVFEAFDLAMIVLPRVV